MTGTTRRSAARVLLTLLLAAIAAATVRAHDIPEEVDIQAYLKPEGGQLRMLLRVPLLAITDVNLPKDGTGFLAMRYLEPALADAAGQVAAGAVLLQGDDRLAQFSVVNARISLPSDRSFDSYAQALALLHGARLADVTQLYYNQGYLDLELAYPVAAGRAGFGIRMLLGKGLANRTVSVVNFVRPDGAIRTFHLVDNTDVVRLDPSRADAARVFLSTGFFRPLDTLEHLLFLIVLVLPFRRLRDLVPTIAAFAAAHSTALALVALGIAPAGPWFAALIAMLLAFSIVYVAVEDAVGANLRRRPLVAVVFGLVHGCAFAFALQESLQFAGGHRVAALIAFNAGLELAQGLVLAIVLPGLTWLLTQAVAERAGTIVIAALAGHAAWHWTIDRFTTLRLTDWPAFDVALAAAAVRWLIVAVAVLGGLWLAGGLLRKAPEEIQEPSILDRH